MKAIIFGVTGQHGSHLVDLLLAKNYYVVGVARRCSVDNTSRLHHIKTHNCFELFEGDITDAHSVAGVLTEHKDVNEIYNLAAQSHVATSFKQPGLTWDITGKGCLNVLQSMVDLGLSAKFYQASSSEMFGASYNTSDNVKYQDENTKFLPQSPYAIAKCAAHYMTRLFREAYGVHASAGILFNHEGPRRGETFVTRKITKWIGDFQRWTTKMEINHTDMLKLDCDRLFASGEQYSFPKLRLGNLDASRDWGYAGDYVEAMWLMLQQDYPDDYVVCTGETHTIRDFLDVAFNRIGITNWSEYVIIDPEFYRPAEVEYLKGCADKAKNNLNWSPKISFSELVELMVDSDIKNDKKL